MNANEVNGLTTATLDGSMPFPAIVGELIAQGVEYYHVDYVARTFTFYSTEVATVTSALQCEGLPSISSQLNAAALKAAIVDTQQHGQKFRQFCERAMLAGVQGYFAFLRGRRVTYFGHNGDQHVEWFPGAKPDEA